MVLLLVVLFLQGLVTVLITAGIHALFGWDPFSAMLLGVPVTNLLWAKLFEGH